MPEIVYIPGDSLAFVAFINSQEGKATPQDFDGHMRWVITREDGTQYIARPSEALSNEH